MELSDGQSALSIVANNDEATGPADAFSQGEPVRTNHEGEDNDDSRQSSDPGRAGLIVGIGSSAGGIDALKTFFSKVPADLGMAFVVVQHLDPNYESSLVSIIGGRTALSVCLAEEGAAVKVGQVHVIPPDAILTIKGGLLRLARPAAPAERRF